MRAGGAAELAVAPPAKARKAAQATTLAANPRNAVAAVRIVAGADALSSGSTASVNAVPRIAVS